MNKVNEKSFISAINRIAATEDGKIIFSWFKNLCGWDATIMANDPSMTQHYASIRSVWGAIRKNIRTEYLKEIEFDFIVDKEVKAVKNDRTSTRNNTTSTTGTSK